MDNKILDEKTKAKLEKDAADKARKAYEDSNVDLASEGFDDIYDYTYATMPAELKEQKERNRRFLK